MENQKLEFSRHTTTDIFIGNELFPNIASKFNIAGFPKCCVIITNETLAKLHLKPLCFFQLKHLLKVSGEV